MHMSSRQKCAVSWGKLAIDTHKKYKHGYNYEDTIKR